MINLKLEKLINSNLNYSFVCHCNGSLITAQKYPAPSSSHSYQFLLKLLGAGCIFR